MRRKPFNTKWKSPSKGNLELSEIPEKILEYYNRMKMFNEHINISIGTDSQNFSFTKEVNVIAITCEHHGGIFFYKITSRDRINDVRQKLHTETQDSLEIADYLVNALTSDEKYEELFLNTHWEIHIDAGYSEKGKTHELIAELVGWVKAQGFDAVVKPKEDDPSAPYPSASSCIADRLSK